MAPSIITRNTSVNKKDITSPAELQLQLKSTSNISPNFAAKAWYPNASLQCPTRIWPVT
jgi:hypothetical protein